MRTLTGWGIALVLLAGCGSPRPLARVRVQERTWNWEGITGVELVTDHFHLHVTAQDMILRQALPTFLETAFQEYLALIPPARSDEERLGVYLFETRQEWARFTRRFDPGHAHTYLHIQAGGYTDYRSGTAVVFDLARDRTLSLLGHEGFHQYAARYLAEPLPAWLNEGLACQFESFDLAGFHPTFQPERNLLRMNNLREALSDPAGMIPFEQFLQMDAGQAIRHAGPPARVYYAQAWSTVVYLREAASPYAAGFRRLLADAGSARLTRAIREYQAKDPARRAHGVGLAAFYVYVTEDLAGFMTDYRAFAERLVGR